VTSTHSQVTYKPVITTSQVDVTQMLLLVSQENY